MYSLFDDHGGLYGTSAIYLIIMMIYMAHYDDLDGTSTAYIMIYM